MWKSDQTRKKPQHNYFNKEVTKESQNLHCLFFVQSYSSKGEYLVRSYNLYLKILKLYLITVVRSHNLYLITMKLSSTLKIEELQSTFISSRTCVCVCVCVCVCMWKPFSCVWLCKPTDCSLPGSSVHRILQTRILEWATIPFSRGSSWPRESSWPRDRTQVSCTAGRFFTPSEPPGKDS